MTKHPSRKVKNFRHLLGCDTIEQMKQFFAFRNLKSVKLHQLGIHVFNEIDNVKCYHTCLYIYADNNFHSQGVTSIVTSAKEKLVVC